MKIYYYCSSCKEENNLKIKSTNRFDLRMELNSDEIQTNCTKCGKLEKKHINRLHTKPNPVMIIIGFLIAIGLTIGLWDMGFISTLSIAIPLMIWYGEQKRVSDFNQNMIERKK